MTQTVTRRRTAAIIPAEPPALTDIQLAHYKVVCDALGPLTPAMVDAAHKVIVKRISKGSGWAVQLLAELDAAGMWART